MSAWTDAWIVVLLRLKEERDGMERLVVQIVTEQAEREYGDG